jgi:hypothetical protein
VAQESALVLVSRLQRELQGKLAALDIDIIGKETAKSIAAIRRLSADARLDVRDYEMAENRAEMLENAATARKRLDELRAQILKASEHGIFSAIDVAQLSTELDVIVADMG